MMNVKKYRGETTREALEKIKRDLGEDAFVLETKQVRAGGFMGLGTKTQIEISATSSVETSAAKERKLNSSVLSNDSDFDLTDNNSAISTVSGQTKRIEKMEIMNALKSRASSVNDFDKSFPYNPKTISNFSRQKEIDVVEISFDAPKVVHQKKEFVEKFDIPTPVARNMSEIAPASVSSRELEMLRAELREVKSSMNAFTSHQSVQPRQVSIEIDVFSLVFDQPFLDSYNELTGLGVSPEVAQNLVAKIIPKFKKRSSALKKNTKEKLRKAIISLIKFGEDPLKDSESAVLAIIGATGVGKTTTIAKLAARIALEERRRVELVTLDTYRIAAVEQLKTYAEIIGVGCHVVRSVSELDGLIRSFPEDVTVLIDTTGRNPHDLADQHELSDYLNCHKEIRKCLAVQATTHPLDAITAVEKFEMYGIDCLAITKLDETTRPGAMLELLAESGLPLVYFCTGQRVPEDLKIATPENFAARIFAEKV